MFHKQNVHNTCRSRSEQNAECSHCLNTYFTMSSSRHISYVAREIFPACLLAGVGMVVAGCYVDMLKSSSIFNSSEANIFEIIPPVLGLKGNLEVALSSRLATVVHFRRKFSEISSWLFTTTLAFILVKFSIVLCVFLQILAVLASIAIPVVITTVHISTSLISYSSINIAHLICISSVTCVCASCLISVLVYAIVCACVFFGANPDNIAPPAAAALGDLATVLIMSRVNGYFMKYPTFTFIAAICITCIVLFLSIAYLLYHSNMHISPEFSNLVITSTTFKETIVPLILAIIMSSISGNISSRFLADLPVVARLQVPINGVGGIFAAMLISRMTTRLHSITCSKKFSLKQSVFASPTSSPSPSSTTPTTTATTTNTCVMFEKSRRHVPSEEVSSSGVSDPPSSSSSSASSLSSLMSAGTMKSCRKLREIYTDVSQVSKLIKLLCVPLHFILTLISVIIARHLNPQENEISYLQFSILIPYISAGFIQICILLKFAKWIVLKLWKKFSLAKQFDSNINATNTPISLASLDFSAIAMTTGLGDLIGTALFVLFLCISKRLTNS
uniref:SLC41A/MgtE integral membrane domain-containing protein n=2 Tax=Trichobilharzia regenti TaxID=157069 RepID=A0AA85IUZ3_TRIRE|nr:unnamed protein product [Trichobilharzia regenti]